MENGTLRDYRMGFDEYRAYLERQKQLAQTVAAKAEKPKKPPKKPPAAKGVSAAKLEREIGRVEARIAENEAAQEAAATDYQRLMELTEEHQALTGELEGLYSAWEEASE